MEIRAELEKKGYSFRSRADSEVVLKAYEEWGMDSLGKFNGMFAFGLWDGKRKELILARDRYGIKPLYYYLSGDVLVFASEIKAILEHPAMTAKVNLPALLEYFTFQNIFTDSTLFEGVKLLPPGTWMRVALGKKDAVETRQYWDYSFREPDSPLSEDEYVEELDRLFRQAVERQLVSDVPVGSYLSGGMDSASITAVAAGHIPYLATFTTGFDMSSASGMELGCDERGKAEFLSNMFKTEHYEAVLKAGDMERVMKPLIWHLEDLRVGQCYPNFYTSRLASKFVKVVLSGAGGDELFAGYPWRYYRAIINEDIDEYVEKYYGFWHRLIPNRFLPELFRPEIWNRIKDIRTIDIFRSIADDGRFPISKPEEYVNKSLYFEIKTFLHGLFIVEDKLSMAYGLETRVPFMDNDLVDFAMSVPVRMKLRDFGETIRISENEIGLKVEKYYRKTRDGKMILRKVMGRYVPSSITEQVKQGFSAPDASWFKGESINYIRDLLLDENARIYGYLQHGLVRRMIEEHATGAKNHRLFIWSLLSFEWWLRTFIQ